jgi:hypothetical protein
MTGTVRVPAHWKVKRYLWTAQDASERKKSRRSTEDSR